MELSNEETYEVFASEAENEKVRDDASDEDEEPVVMSDDEKQRRRVSDIIDSMGDDGNLFHGGFTTPRRRRINDESTDLISPDQGYPDTPVSMEAMMPDWMKKSVDFQDANMSVVAEFHPPSSTPTVLTAPMPVYRDADCYNMQHKYRGKCVIFNHEKFDTGFEDRVGSSIDAKRIERTFEKLGFTVEILDNLEHVEIIEKLSQLSEDDHNDADCMCIFVLTHGMSNDLICARDVAYKVDRIWKPFTADRCKTLAGKPKLFFFQACRGTELDDGVTLARVETVRSETDSSAENSYKIPNHADFLIAHSSAQGFYSWRNPTDGTWFVQSLCQVLDQYADTTDLLKMMTITSRIIATTRASYHDIDPYKNDKKQVPSITSMLLRDVYFTPKQ